LFGYEESYGYLRGTHARDKDAVVASMLTAEMLCYYTSIGKGLFDRLTELFEEYGYYREAVTSVAYKGVEAMSDMAKTMARLRKEKVEEIAGEKVLFTSDYLTRISTYPDGKTEELTLPKTDAIKYNLKDEQFVCIRPSGTEPKLKVYVLCFDDSAEKAEKKAAALLEDIKKRL
jgi:phosphoglucomutase